MVSSLVFIYLQFETKNQMKSKILNNSFYVFAIAILMGCHLIHKSAKQPLPASPVAFPKATIPFPATNLNFLLPDVELAETDTHKKDITTKFKRGEDNEIRVKDPKLFANGNTEIIDLSFLTNKEYAFPLAGGKVISPYGGRRRHHSGADIKTCANDTIVAAFDGIVRMAKPYAAYGNLIIIRHYNGLETLYSHNSKNLVKPGDLVKAGQPIALTGRTGRATTEHLHFEIRINGEHFNPNIVFNLEKNKLQRRCLVCTKKGNNIIVKSVNILPHQSEGKYTYKK